MSGRHHYDRQVRLRDPESGGEYTFDEFVAYYGQRKGRDLWARAEAHGQQRHHGHHRPKHHYTLGMKVCALVQLEGDNGKIVRRGAVGRVTGLPGRGSNITTRGAVAEVVIKGVRFDALADMVEPADGPPSYDAPSYGRDHYYPQPHGGEHWDYHDHRGYHDGSREPWHHQREYRGHDVRNGHERGANEERRRDPSDPTSRKSYTQSEFIQYYGGGKGRSLWTKAGSGAEGVEKRRDVSKDGGSKLYTKQEFVDYYGAKAGSALWKKAGAQPQQAAAQEAGGRPSREDKEKRHDPNEPGSTATYFKHEFVELYGERKGTALWNRAEEKRADPSEETGKKYTRQEFIDLYGAKKGAAIWKRAAPKADAKAGKGEKGAKGAKGEKSEVKPGKAKDGEATEEQKALQKEQSKKATYEVIKVDGSIGWTRFGTIVLEVEEGKAACKAGVSSFVKIITVNGKKAHDDNIGALTKADKLTVAAVPVRREQNQYFTFREFADHYGLPKACSVWTRLTERSRKKAAKSAEKAAEKAEKTAKPEEKPEKEKAKKPQPPQPPQQHEKKDKK